MTVVPRFAYPPGTELTLFSRKLLLNRLTDTGYEFVDREEGDISVVPFLKLVEFLGLPGTTIDTQVALSGSDLAIRLGGYVSWKSLSKEQQEKAQLHHALCQAMSMLQDNIRRDTERPRFSLSIRKLDEWQNREFICKVASSLLAQPVRLAPPRGGKTDCCILYKGRTLMKYFTAYEAVLPGENPLDALATLDHLKGNCHPRITWRHKELMKQAWEEIGLDTKGPAVANVMKHFLVLLHEENLRLERRGATPLLELSASTLRRFRDELLTETEYLTATKGERHARNKKGRGSPDVRALLIGELVEIDECKISLVSSAKANGVWETLSSQHKATLEEIDEEIRARLTLLVMIDVASRMPLAWVISDQPKAIATLALFRMATRDKTREKVIYGCHGDPMPGIGLGNVRMDNGSGLRNSVSLGALVGAGATATVVRAFNSTDKPYVERLFGTTESVLFKIIHGYTGRKAGDLPGYDAQANGVLDIDELFGIVTRFFIDEYPSMPHMGVGMGGRRPYEVYRYINENRGIFRPLDENERRIHLGWKAEATPNDEGVRVFGGLWYSSPKLQKELDGHRDKVSVFIDPDDVSKATILVPGRPIVYQVEIQTTAFADLTLAEVLDLMAAWRKEHPTITQIHDDRLWRTRRQRFDLLRTIGVERKLPRSYSTIEEAKVKASHVFAGARVVRTRDSVGTAEVGSIALLDRSEGTFQLGSSSRVIDGTTTQDASDRGDLILPPLDLPAPERESGTVMPTISRAPTDSTAVSSSTAKAAANNKGPTQFLGRPKDPRTLE